MLTERIDRALDALVTAQDRVPALRDIYRPSTPERTALDDLLSALRRVNLALGLSAPESRAPED